MATRTSFGESKAAATVPTTPAAIPRHPAWATARMPAAADAATTGTQSAVRTASAIPAPVASMASAPGMRSSSPSNPAPARFAPIRTSFAPWTCCAVANRPIPSPSVSRRRFSPTAASSSPTANDRFRDSYGLGLTPPERASVSYAPLF